MTQFISTIILNPEWFFIAMGGLLLIIELLGAGGYSLWSGISSFIVGFIAFILPFSWAFLWLLFAILTLVTAYVWWRWLKRNENKSDNNANLNQPQKELIGLTTVVVESIENGTGRVKIKDGSWLAHCSEDIKQGTKVKVISVDGITLHVIKSE